MDSTHHPMGFLGDIPSPKGSSPSAVPGSHYTTFETPESPGALPSIPDPNDEARTADTMLFQLGHNAYENSKSQMPRDALREKPAADLKMVRTDSNFQTNASITSLSPYAFTRSTPPLVLHSEEQVPSSKQQDSASEQTLPIMTFMPGQPLEPPKLSLSDSMADESYSKIGNSSQLSPSIVPLVENKPEIQSPAYNVPFITPHHTTLFAEPTELSPEDYYPTNTMEVDWGSGDYLETMSFYNSDGDAYSLVTKVPSDPYDLEDYTESYDTSFPSRVGISPSSLNPLNVSPSPSLMTANSAIVPHKSINPSTISTSVHITLETTPTPNTDISDVSDIDWADTFTIQPTDVLLPDMNSLEYYTTQLTKENNSTQTGAEHGGNVTVVSINATEITPTIGFTSDSNLTADESSGDLSGYEAHDESTTVATTESPQSINISEPFLDPSIVPTYFFDTSSSKWLGQVSTTDWSTHTSIVGMDTALAEPSATPVLPEDLISSSSLTDVHWFVTDSFSESTIHTTTVLTATIAFSPSPTDPAENSTASTTELTFPDSTFTTEQTPDMSSVSTDSTSHNVTLVPPVMLGDQGVTEDGADIPATMTLIPTSSEVNTVSAAPTSTAATTTPHQATTGANATTEASTSVNIISTTSEKTTATTARQYLCRHDRPAYLTKIGKFNLALSYLTKHYLNVSCKTNILKTLLSVQGFPSGATVGYAKSQIRDILKGEFNKSVELQVKLCYL